MGPQWPLAADQAVAALSVPAPAFHMAAARGNMATLMATMLMIKTSVMGTIRPKADTTNATSVVRSKFAGIC